MAGALASRAGRPGCKKRSSRLGKRNKEGAKLALHRLWMFSTVGIAIRCMATRICYDTNEPTVGRLDSGSRFVERPCDVG